MRAAREKPVARPSRRNHAEVPADDLEGEAERRRRRKRKPLRLHEKRRPPVERGKSYHVHEEVRDCENPDARVAQNVVADELLVCRVLLLRANHLRLAPGNRRKPHVLRRVLHREEEPDRASNRDSGGNEEAEPPRLILRNYPPPEEREHPARADGMREVPDRLLRGELVRREPQRKRLHARPHAHPLKVAVQYPDDSHGPDESCGRGSPLGDGRRRAASYKDVAHAEHHVQDAADEESERHHLSGAAAVGQHPIREARKAVEEPSRRKKRTKLNLRDAYLAEKRHRKRQVLADDVVEGVAAHRYKQRLPLPVGKRSGGSGLHGWHPKIVCGTRIDSDDCLRPGKVSSRPCIR